MPISFIEIRLIDASNDKNQYVFELPENQSIQNGERTISLFQKCPNLSQAVVFLHNYFRFKPYRERVEKNLESTLVPRLENDVNVQIICLIGDWNLGAIALLDTNWSHRIQYLATLRLEMEESLSWLSTLGGAYSSLGDYKIDFAKQAEKISMSQLRLSFIYSDPNLTARCMIYLCHSWGQQHKLRQAKRMVKYFLYPFLLQIGPLKRDIVVQRMYQSLCFRIRYIYK